MRILLCNWRDLRHPKAGGAELQTHILARGLSDRGHSVTIATSKVPAGRDRSTEQYRTLRFGNELTCRVGIAQWLSRNSEAYDVVVDEVNTLPFLSRFIVPRKTVLWIHQLAREVWLKEAPFPANYFGYALEPTLMHMYRTAPVITGAQSTAHTLREFGFRGAIDVIEYALDPPHPTTLEPNPGSIGYVGRLVPSKRVDHIIRAVKILADKLPHVSLDVVGSGPARERLRLEHLVAQLGLADRVSFKGRLPDADRDALMSRFDVLAMASVREGWGLVVAEAARFGTPSVVYPVPGLIDAVEHGVSGLTSRAQTPEALAWSIEAVISNRERRTVFGRGARERLIEYSEQRFIDRFEARLQAHHG